MYMYISENVLTLFVTDRQLFYFYVKIQIVFQLYSNIFVYSLQIPEFEFFK